MRIFDPQKALKNKAAIKAAIFDHGEKVTNGTATLDQLDLTQYGIQLESHDWITCRKRTKKTNNVYREEIVLLSGLWRSICVRLNVKKRESVWRPE